MRGRVVGMSPVTPPRAPAPPPHAAPWLAPVLAVTRDPALVAEVQRCAAGTGVEVEVREWGPEVMSRWAGASMVLLGDDVTAAVAAAGLRRRDEVHLLCRGTPGADDYRYAVAVGAESVTGLDAARDRLRDLLQERVTAGARGQVVAVLPGSGGAGASTTVAALAQAASRRGLDVLVLDCDPTGAGVARILGADDLTGLGWSDLLASPGRVGPVSLADAVPRVGPVGVVAGARDTVPGAVVSEVAETARRVHDLVLVDLPRHGAATGGVVARADRSLLVVRPGLVGVAAAVRQVDSWAGVTGDPAGPARVGVVVRGRGAASSSVSDALGLPVVARLPEHRDVEEALALGLGPVPRRRGAWARAVESLLAGLASPAARPAGVDR